MSQWMWCLFYLCLCKDLIIGNLSLILLITYWCARRENSRFQLAISIWIMNLCLRLWWGGILTILICQSRTFLKKGFSNSEIVVAQCEAAVRGHSCRKGSFGHRWKDYLRHSTARDQVRCCQEVARKCLQTNQTIWVRDWKEKKIGHGRCICRTVSISWCRLRKNEKILREK